jgi:hypothetical protein
MLICIKKFFTDGRTVGRTTYSSEPHKMSSNHNFLEEIIILFLLEIFAQGIENFLSNFFFEF